MGEGMKQQVCSGTKCARLLWTVVLCAVLLARAALQPVAAAVLPEERADALYHSYDGGGVEISGPSLSLVKRVGSNAAASVNYYVDSISSASIDVVTTASPYEERREEVSAGVQYLEGDSLMNFSYTRSEENDFGANSARIGFSQEMFGNLTTLSIGYSRGWDDVGTRNSPAANQAERNQYRLGLSQVLTKNLLLDTALETITDEGYLNNPYRTVRFINADDPKGYSHQQEVYPRTRTSHAFALRPMYYLPYRAAVYAEYRIFSDSWGIGASNWELGYRHPWREDWVFDVSYRHYEQTAAEFYKDLFPYRDAQNYLARDKELSTFTSGSLGFKISYAVLRNWSAVRKSTLNLSYRYIQFDYDDFRDLRVSAAPGQEPLYSFSANVVQLFLSVWY